MDTAIDGFTIIQSAVQFTFYILTTNCMIDAPFKIIIKIFRKIFPFCFLCTLQNYLQFFPSGKAASAGEMNLTIPPENTSVPLASDGEKGCESCHSTVSSRWVSWGPAHDHCRLCGHCYVYWRKYGGLKLPTRWGKE